MKKMFLVLVVAFVSIINVYSKEYTYIIKAENKKELTEVQKNIFKELNKKYGYFHAHITTIKTTDNNYKVTFTIKD